MKLQGLRILAASLAVVGAGCSLQESPTSPQMPRASALAKDPGSTTAATQQTIPGFVVAYTGRTVANGTTTFSYSVTATADGSAMSQLVLQVPPCAGSVVALSPNTGTIGPDQQSGLYGVKWGNVSLSSGQSLTYSYTFAGDVPEGFIRVAAKVGTTVNRFVLPGPCQYYLISGTVFVDPDSSGTRNQANEAGIIANVTVTLVDGEGNVRTALTDAFGHYEFKGFDGTYTVRVDSSTPTTDFNEQLFDAFWATGPSTTTFSITGDSPGHDFGYKPKAKKIATDIALGVILTTGKDRSFWIKVVRTVSHGGTYGGYDATAVLGFLAQIEGEYFPQPYQLTDGSELASALDILTENARDALTELHRELFVSELNDAAGLGLVNDPDLQDVLLSWGEGLIVSRTGVAIVGNNTPPVAAKPATIETDIQSALTVFNNLNQRGGGTIPD